MAEPVQLQALQTAMAASPVDIKQEPEPEVNILDGIDFTMIAELASKRSFDDISRDDDTHNQEAKRLKTETQTEEESLEDGLALLVQNALSNVGDLVDQLNVGSDAPTSHGHMNVHDAHGADDHPATVSFLSEPEKYVRIANTHALGNLALSLLLVLLQQPVDDMSKLARDADSGYGRSYGRLKRSFDATWQLFSDSPVLSADELEMPGANARTLLELANLARFGSWLIEEGTQSFSAAERHFPAIFQCRLPDIPAGTMQVLIGLKTQNTIGALFDKKPEQEAEDLVRTCFSEGLEEMLGASMEDSELSPTAQELISSIRTRRDALIEVVKLDDEVLLKERFPASEALRSFEAHVKLKFASLTELGERLGISALLSEVTAAEPMGNGAGAGELDLDDLSSFFEKTASGLVQNALAGLTEVDQFQSQTQTQNQTQDQTQTQTQTQMPSQNPSQTPSQPPSQSQAPAQHHEQNHNHNHNHHIQEIEQTPTSVESYTAEATATTPATIPAPALAPTSASAPGSTPTPDVAITTTAAAAEANIPTESKPTPMNGKIDLMTDYKELEALVAESTSNYVKTTLHGLSAIPYQLTVPTSTTESMAAQSTYLSNLQQHQSHNGYYAYTQPAVQEQQAPQAGSTENLPPNQTFPSAILYDKARQAALSKSSAHTRREGLHSTRRPWTQEEEKALMAGLDMVKGPHWSQILTLFGQNGTISDILKDRTQVQLKDKARNLKLFFLKTNSEMPYYLQAVTGELKTRAPTQAARKEAEERARLNSEEEQAKLHGIMALAGGLQQTPTPTTSQPQQQQQHQARTATTTATTTTTTTTTATSGVGPGVVTPAQAAQQAASGRLSHHGPSTTGSRGMVMPTLQAKPEAQATATEVPQTVPPAPSRGQTSAHEPQHQQQQQLPHEPQQQQQEEEEVKQEQAGWDARARQKDGWAAEGGMSHVGGQDEDAAEAALLEGLQAAVAQALAS